MKMPLGREKLLFFHVNREAFYIVFFCLHDEKHKQQAICSHFIWMLNKKVLPLQRFTKKPDISDPKQ